MSNHPLPPSDLDPSNPRSPEARRAMLRAVLTGVSVDICGSTLLSLVLRTIYAACVSTPGMTQAQIDDAVAHMPAQSPLNTLGILLGALISVLAGYVCARIARRGEFRAGAFLAGGVALMCLLMGEGDSESADLTLLFLASSAACNLLGVKYGTAQNRRLQERAAAVATDTSTP